MNIFGDILRDHGIGANRKFKYYRVRTRKHLPIAPNSGGNPFAEMTDDGGFICLDQTGGLYLKKYNKTLGQVYSVAVRTGGGSVIDPDAHYDRGDGHVYIVDRGLNTLYKFRASDGYKVFAVTTHPVSRLHTNTDALFILDWASKKVSKLSKSTGSVIWSYTLPEITSNSVIQVNDAGEAFVPGSTVMYKINASGTGHEQIMYDGRYKDNKFRVFPGLNHIFYKLLGLYQAYSFTGALEADLEAESADLGYFTNHNYNPLDIKVTKNRLIVIAGTQDTAEVLIFDKTTYALLDALPVKNGTIATHPDHDDFILVAHGVDSQANRQINYSYTLRPV